MSVCLIRFGNCVPEQSSAWLPLRHRLSLVIYSKWKQTSELHGDRNSQWGLRSLEQLKEGGNKEKKKKKLFTELISAARLWYFSAGTCNVLWNHACTQPLKRLLKYVYSCGEEVSESSAKHFLSRCACTSSARGGVCWLVWRSIL